MANTKRTLAMAVTVSATLLTAGLATAADVGARTIVLHVDDYAGLPPSEWETAKTEATHIYARAGVRTIWTTAPNLAPSSETTLHLTVVLLSAEMAEAKIASEGIGRDVLGQAARPTRRAYIFPHRIARTAGAYYRSTGLVLGKVIAHEVGHLVLPRSGHSTTGIMRANLDLRGDMPTLFTKEEKTAIHTTLGAGN